MQQQMLGISRHPAHTFFPEHDHQPLQGDDQGYSNTGISQQGEVVTSGKPKYGTSIGAAVSDK